MNPRCVLVLLLAASWPRPAHAFCRTNTCQVDNTCTRDDQGCSVGGLPAHWASGCLSFSMQAEGSPLQGISVEAALDVAHDAFSLWTEAKCHAGGTPPLTFQARGEVECHVPEFNCNPADPNANVIMFQDEGWTHSPAALAVTCVTLNLRTGEILDADMEINTTPPYWDFSLPGGSTGADLHTVITHEAGHFVGLDHSTLTGAVMYESYDDTVLLSSLSDDDIAGVCSIYPGTGSDPECASLPLPDDTSCVGESACVPMKKESEGCSCSVAERSTGPGMWFGLLAGLGCLRRTRRKARRAPAGRRAMLWARGAD